MDDVKVLDQLRSLLNAHDPESRSFVKHINGLSPSNLDWLIACLWASPIGIGDRFMVCIRLEAGHSEAIALAPTVRTYIIVNLY